MQQSRLPQISQTCSTFFDIPARIFQKLVRAADAALGFRAERVGVEIHLRPHPRPPFVAVSKCLATLAVVHLSQRLQSGQQ
jgi:hypothetical protein